LHDAVQTFRYVDLVAFAALGAVTVAVWLRRRDRAGAWAAAAFGSLGLLELLTLIPNHPGNLAERGVGRVEIALLVVFPYLLFRFTHAFRPPGRTLGTALVGLTAALVVWTFALPSIPQPGEPRSTSFAVFVSVFFVHWALLSILSATSLWRAGRTQPNVVRRRLRFLAFAVALITVALLLVVLPSGSDSGLALGSNILATISVVAFFLAFAPPAPLRMLWRAPEEQRMQEAITSLLAFAESQEEVASRVLEPAAGLVGASALAIRNAEGRVVAAWNMPPDLPAPGERSGLVDLEVPGGSLVVRLSPYAPFFGDEELRLLATLGALVGLALDRVRLYQREHETRLALERADEVKTNFVALAAHELRTPMTTIHGFVTTLYHLGERLSESEREEVQNALLQQTQRMATLIEQLLDLSRLDANAIEIAPEPIDVRAQVEVIVASASPDPDAVEIDVPPDTIAVVDRSALERIVTNLVTNAFRYGVPPVRVAAERTDRHLRLSVEDRGEGVPTTFVPDLFERFTRSDRSRASATGTGLGLAIARSYARAHGGDLLYEDAEPHGARFSLVLPVGR
jgi:signal transduction histidine kinase